MLKAAGTLLVIFSCAALGYAGSMGLARRRTQLQEIEKMLTLLLGEIAYRKEALPEAMLRIAEKVQEPLAGFLREVSHTAELYQGERFSSIFREKAEAYLKDSGMVRRDLEEFSQVGEYLGYLDIAMQKNTIALYLEQLKREIGELDREIPVKGKLYRSMGVLFGIFLVIVFS